MSSWHSYPKIYNVGHSAVADLLDHPVVVEEKVDGSQFSFGLFKDGLRVRSKGATFPVDAPEGMFKQACETVLRIQHGLVPGWTYRAEYLQSPSHNALRYDRVPKGHLIIFDIHTEDETYAGRATIEAAASSLELEAIPQLFTGILPSAAHLESLLDTTSILGGQKIEGVVIKPIERNVYGADKKVLMAKHVSPAFREVHAKSWREKNPTRNDIVAALIEQLRTPARWQKALIHLREKGLIEGSPRDIGALIREAQSDLREEEEMMVRDRLFTHFWPQIQRASVAGLAEWYKESLLQKQFEEESK